MELKELIKQHEGSNIKNGRHYPYIDTVGKVTVGWGWNLTDNGLPEAVAETLLDISIDEARNNIASVFGDLVPSFTENRYNALVDMMLNMGLTRFKGFAKMIGAIQAGDWETASQEAFNSTWAIQVKNRAIEDADLLKNG